MVEGTADLVGDLMTDLTGNLCFESIVYNRLFKLLYNGINIPT